MPTWSEFLSTQTLHTVLGDTNTLSGLDHLGMIRVSGTDARTFLQGQLSSDIQQLAAEQTQLSGYCNPKGRLLAIFRIVPVQDDLLLILPKALLPVIQRRLQLYILRSDVRLQDESTSLAILEMAGPDIEALVPTAPAALNTQIQIDDLYIVRLPGDRPRLQVIGPVVAIQSLWQQGIKQQASPTDAQAWRLLDIRAGLPMIYLATSEAFVPQMTNLQLVGGVSFKKGCYTGQEVVARMHYLGKQKRQMYRVQIPSGVVVQVGQALYATDTPEQSVGTVLEVAPVGLDTGYEALVVCQIKSMENATSSLYLEGQTKAVITDLGLPYSHATS